MKYVKWFLINVGVLSIFILGYLLDNNGFIYFALGLYWFQIFSGMVMLSEDIRKAIVKKAKENPSNKYLNISWDIAISIMLAYCGFWLTAIFYIIHLIAYLPLYDEIADKFNK